MSSSPTTDSAPEQQLTAAAMYAQAPASAAAEQYTAGKTAMTLTTLLSTSIDYTTAAPTRSAHCQSLANPAKNYKMNDTDWLVVGPNLEIVYTATQFAALYAPATGNKMSYSVGPTSDDPLSAQLIAYIGGASGTLDIDWGDGSAHDTPSVGVGINPTITHTYPAEGYYSIWVAFIVGGSQAAAAGASFQAKIAPPFSMTGISLPPGSSLGSDGGAGAGMYSLGGPVSPGMPNGANPTGVGTVVTGPSRASVGAAGEGIASVGTYSTEEIEAAMAGAGNGPYVFKSGATPPPDPNTTP